MSNTKKVSLLAYVAILGLFFFSGCTTFMNAAMQTMIDAHPQTDPTVIRTIGTLPSVISTIAMILVGSMVGKRFSYKFAAVFGSLLILIGGTLPAFINSSWTLVLAFMSILGVGVGFIGIRNTFIVRCIPEKDQASYIGYGNVVMNVGAAIAGPVVGWLATKGWNQVFWFNAVSVIPFLLALFFLPNISGGEEETAKVEEVSESVEEKAATKKGGWKLYFYPIFQLINVLTLYPLLSGMSTLLVTKGLGNSVAAGTALTCYTIAGALVGLAIGQIEKRMGRTALGITTLATAVCVFGIISAKSLIVVYVATFVCGFVFNASPSLLQFYNGRQAPAAKVGFYSTLIIAAMQLGIFGSNYYISACHAIFNRSSDIESALWGCIIIYVVLGVFSLIVKITPDKE